MKVIILVSEDSMPAQVSAALEIFSKANYLFQMENPRKDAPYDVRLMGMNHKNVQIGRNNAFVCDLVLDEYDDADWIIIPALDGGELKQILRRNNRFVHFVRKQHAAGKTVASLCTGAAFITGAGLLDGKSCTTHWFRIPEFEQLFPKVTFEIGPTHIQHENVYTSAGAFASNYLLFYLIEQDLGKETAVMLSKLFVTDYYQETTAYQTSFLPYKMHEDRCVLAAQDYIEIQYSNPITVEEAAHEAGLGVRNFIKRFKAAAHCTPIEYIQRVRIEMAKRALESGQVQINEAMYDVGYSDKKSFRNLFKRFTGITPAEYRNRYNRVSVGTLV